MDNKISLWEKVFNNQGYKFLLFLVSYVVAVTITLLLIIAILSKDNKTFFTYFFTGLFWFPYGLVMIFRSFQSTGFQNTEWSYFLYFIIAGFAVFTKNGRIAKILYFIFVSLLLLNIIWICKLASLTGHYSPLSYFFFHSGS